VVFTSAIVIIPNGFANWICGFRLGGEVDVMHLLISGFDGDHCSLGFRTFEVGFANIVDR